jgi:hypothetical protein
MDFWRRAAIMSKILKVRNEVIREKMGVTQTILERMEYNMLKWYGHVLCMKDNRWPKRITTWLLEGIIRIRGRPEMQWKREVGRVMKQKNLTPEDTINWQLW